MMQPLPCPVVCTSVYRLGRTESLNNSESVPAQKRRILWAYIALFQNLQARVWWPVPVCSWAALSADPSLSAHGQSLLTRPCLLTGSVSAEAVAEFVIREFNGICSIGWALGLSILAEWCTPRLLAIHPALASNPASYLGFPLVLFVH